MYVVGSNKAVVQGLPASPKRFEQAGNPHYPLPPDYLSLSPEEQRLARLNALCLQETPEDVVTAWQCLDTWYLRTLPLGVWYAPPLYNSPPIHYAFIYSLAAYARNIFVMPRSFGKSILIRAFILLMALTRPYFTMSLIKSRVGFIHSDFIKIKRMLATNPAILRDFGRLVPRKGEGLWSNEHIVLRNGFELFGMSVMSTQLGPRPRMWIADDSEFDPKMRVSPTLLAQNFRELLKEQLLPQLDSGCSGHIVGTMASQKMNIYRMGTISEEEDPGIAYWNREIYGVYDEAGNLTFPEKYSEERIQALRDELGDAAFMASYMNVPGSDFERTFNLHPNFGRYVVSDVDPALERSPLRSQATLTVWRPGEVSAESGQPKVIEVRRPFGPTVGRMMRVLLIDPCKKPGPYSDYAALLVVGRENSSEFKDTLFLLDLCLERIEKTQIINKAWEMGLKWRVRTIGCEATSGFQHDMAERMASEFSERALEEQWMPRVQPLLYKGDAKKDKGQRIHDALQWRFETHRIKFPWHLRLRKDWSAFLRQIEDFTIDLNLLQHDDAIDSLAMFHYIMKPRGGYGTPEAEPDQQDVLDMMRAGHQFVPGTNIPLMFTIPITQITRDARIKITQLQAEAEDKRRQKFRRRGYMPKSTRRILT